MKTISVRLSEENFEKLRQYRDSMDRYRRRIEDAHLAPHFSLFPMVTMTQALRDMINRVEPIPGDAPVAVRTSSERPEADDA